MECFAASKIMQEKNNFDCLTTFKTSKHKKLSNIFPTLIFSSNQGKFKEKKLQNCKIAKSREKKRKCGGCLNNYNLFLLYGKNKIVFLRYSVCPWTPPDQPVHSPYSQQTPTGFVAISFCPPPPPRKASPDRGALQNNPL